MMRKTILLLALLGAVFCQEVLVNSQTWGYSTGTAVSKTFQYPQWDNERDFAIYGWFKIESRYTLSEWTCGFHFASNNQNWQNAAQLGDRVLGFFIINNILRNPTYSVATNTADSYDNLNFTPADTDKWAFVYIAHGSASSTQFMYYKFASSGVQQKRITNITHKTSTFYQIKIGQSFMHKYFPGSMYRLTIHGGQGAYRESGFETLTNIVPDQLPNCVVVFTGCAFTGTAVNVCNNIPNFDVNTIKSVYIPSGQTLNIHNQANYSGKKVTYNQSIECITQFNWAMLVANNYITVEDEKPSIKRNSIRKRQ